MDDVVHSQSIISEQAFLGLLVRLLLLRPYGTCSSWSVAVCYRYGYYLGTLFKRTKCLARSLVGE